VFPRALRVGHAGGWLGCWLCGVDELADAAPAPPSGSGWLTGSGSALSVCLSGLERVDDAGVADDDGAGQEQGDGGEAGHAAPASPDVDRGRVFDGGVGALGG